MLRKKAANHRMQRSSGGDVMQVVGQIPPPGYLNRYPFGGHNENILDRNSVIGFRLPGNRSGLRPPGITGRVAERH